VVKVRYLKVSVLKNNLQNKSIISHFENPDDGINKLGSVGLNSVPSWYKPYQVLSNVKNLELI
jgi:hypothetical protein